MYQEIYVIDEEEKLTQDLEKLFEKHDKIKFRRIATKDLQLIFKNMILYMRRVSIYVTK